MRVTYTPAEYALSVLHGKFTDRTVLNWIKRKIIPAENETVERTPTGRYLIHVAQPNPTKVEQHFQAIIARRKRGEA